MEAGGVEGVGEGHRWQDGSELARQPRLPCPRGAKDEQIMVRTPASHSVFLSSRKTPMVSPHDPLPKREQRQRITS